MSNDRSLIEAIQTILLSGRTEECIKLLMTIFEKANDEEAILELFSDYMKRRKSILAEYNNKKKGGE